MKKVLFLFHKENYKFSCAQKKLFFLWFILFIMACKPQEITNFDQCVKAGNPVMESYPEQCKANGKTFVNEIEKEDVKETVKNGTIVEEIIEIKENKTEIKIETKAEEVVVEEEIKMGNRHAIIETNMGTIEIELFEDKAPITTDNFITLAEKGYYNGIIFHRIIPDFMIQGGDPTGTGTGGPGYKIKDEFGQGLKHTSAGMLSMANSGPNTGGSQFFITLAPTPWLDGKHAIFGKVVKGMDVLEAIGSVETDSQDRPKKEVVMKKVTIK